MMNALVVTHFSHPCALTKTLFKKRSVTHRKCVNNGRSM